MNRDRDMDRDRDMGRDNGRDWDRRRDQDRHRNRDIDSGRDGYRDRERDTDGERGGWHGVDRWGNGGLDSRWRTNDEGARRSRSRGYGELDRRSDDRRETIRLEEQQRQELASRAMELEEKVRQRRLSDFFLVGSCIHVLGRSHCTLLGVSRYRKSTTRIALWDNRRTEAGNTTQDARTQAWKSLLGGPGAPCSSVPV